MSLIWKLWWFCPGLACETGMTQDSNHGQKFITKTSHFLDVNHISWVSELLSLFLSLRTLGVFLWWGWQKRLWEDTKKFLPVRKIWLGFSVYHTAQLSPCACLLSVLQYRCKQKHFMAGWCLSLSWAGKQRRCHASGKDFGRGGCKQYSAEVLRFQQDWPAGTASSTQYSWENHSVLKHTATG